MIEKRLVQWYAADAGVDLDIAEREIVLTYVLRILADRSLLAQLAFKGGTAIRQLIFGGQGRFSLDLDFTATTAVEPDAFVLDLAGCLHGQTYYGVHHCRSGLLRHRRFVRRRSRLPARLGGERSLRPPGEFPSDTASAR